MSTPTIAERVAAGAAWLDEHRPGWWREVDLEELRMESVCYCVLGQLYNGYYYNAPITIQEAIPLGFDTTQLVVDDGSLDAARVEFDALTEAWDALIEGRRAEAAVSA